MPTLYILNEHSKTLRNSCKMETISTDITVRYTLSNV